MSWVALILAALAPQTSPLEVRDEQRFTIPGIAGSGFTVPLESMLARRFRSVIRQQYDFSCGSAALATLLRFHYGVRADESAVFNGMWNEGDRRQIQAQGFSLLDMKRYLGAIRLNAEGYRVKLEQVAKTRIPGIALTVTEGYRHFVVIKGITDDEVLVGDPSRGLVVASREDFEKGWDGLFFVITTAPEIGKGSFNSSAQWSGVNRAPLGDNLGRPVELDALRLTAPDFGAF